MTSSSEAAEAVADAIFRFGEQTVGSGFEAAVTTPFDRDRWRKLAEMGVLALRPGAGTGDNGMVFAACAALGEIGFAGPLPASFLACTLLDGERADAIAAGTSIVSLGRAPLMPWAGDADVFVSLDDDGATRLEIGASRPTDMLGGEGWAAVEVAAAHPLGEWRRHRSHYDLPLAGYLVGAATRLMTEAAAYAGERRQFGKAIGEFQGVALPLANAATRVDAARVIGTVAADRLDAASTDGEALVAVARRLATLAARGMAEVAHQTFGAIGTVAAGPVFTLSRRIQQWSRQAPEDAVPDAVIALASTGSLRLLGGHGLPHPYAA